MEFRNIISLYPIMENTCAHLSNDDQINFCIATNNLDHLFFKFRSGKKKLNRFVFKDRSYFKIRDEILTNHVERLSSDVICNLRSSEWDFLSEESNLSEDFIREYSNKLNLKKYRRERNFLKILFVNSKINLIG